MRRLVLPLALLTLAAPLGAQTMPPHVAEIARILQTGGLLPDDLTPYEHFGPAWSRADLLRWVSAWVAPGREGPGRPAGFTIHSGAEPLDTLRTFVADLRTSGAISGRTERRLRQRLETEETARARLRLGLAQTAAQLTDAEDLYQPGPLAESLDALVATGALTPASRASMDSLLDRDRIENSAELAAAFPTGVLVPDLASGESTEDAVRRTITAIADVLRQRQIADLNIGEVRATLRATVEPWGDKTRHDVVARATISGRDYSTEAFMDFTDPGEAPEAARLPLHELAPLINKALRDAGAEHRVYAVVMDYYAREWSETTGTAFLALTAEQAEAASAPPLALVSEYTILRNDTLSTTRTASMLGLLRDAGLLNEGSTDRLDALDRSYAASPEDILKTLGLLLYIDGEMGDLDTPYVSLAKDLAALSHGLFAPEALDGAFDWETQSASLAFTLGGMRYATDLEFNGDWMDGTALQLVDRALREASGATLYTAVYARYDDGRPMAGDKYMILTEPQRALVEREGWLEILPYTEWATSPTFPEEDGADEE